ncbi:hypothetical protein L6452_12278 [Arctium lappa]|uniref:Uncharacterized protein n=1 Tax=Arctium lappa TaxID=4217 RepID=A0ACB9DQB4_ARCLA|nr:hypothetical protein L6452_12278 [Arctium lappa]
MAFRCGVNIDKNRAAGQKFTPLFSEAAVRSGFEVFKEEVGEAGFYCAFGRVIVDAMGKGVVGERMSKLDEKISYVEKPVAIQDRAVKKLRSKEVSLVKSSVATPQRLGSDLRIVVGYEDPTSQFVRRRNSGDEILLRGGYCNNRV